MIEMPSYLAGQEQAAGLIPPGSPTFHLLLAVHIAAALTCVVTGAVAALSRKRPGRHPRFGTLYYRSLSVVFASAAWLAALRWPQDAYLLVLGTLSFAAATLGRTARRRRWRWHRWRWIGLHLTGMSASYILLLTAFYVDNGKHLPVWKSLPHLTYWLLPSAVGLPLVACVLARYHGLAARNPPTLGRRTRPRPSGLNRSLGVVHQPPCAGSRPDNGCSLLAQRRPLPSPTGRRRRQGVRRGA